jgi:anti-sigma B factor antagonist
VQDVHGPTGDEPTPQDRKADTAATPFAAVTTEPGSVHVIVGSERTRIVLAGDVDADLAPDLQEATGEAEQAGLPIEVDSQHVTFMDSSGVAFLARLSTRSPWRVRVLRAPPTVRFLLEVTRIGELLDLVDEDPGSDPTLPDGSGPQPS